MQRFSPTSGTNGESTSEGRRDLEEPIFSASLAEWMNDHRSSHIPYLAERGDEAIGMTWLALVERVPGPRRFVRRSAYIQSSYVIPSERSRGVGTLLMTFVLGHARSLGCDYVAVHPSERSFEFYRHLGLVGTDRVLEIRFSSADV